MKALLDLRMVRNDNWFWHIYPKQMNQLNQMKQIKQIKEMKQMMDFIYLQFVLYFCMQAMLKLIVPPKITKTLTLTLTPTSTLTLLYVTNIYF